MKNISEINQLNQMLADLGDVLSEENAMLEAENKMTEEQTRIRQQNTIYDSIARRVSPQLDKISELLIAPAQEEKIFIQNMKYACILNTYVKRCSNLLLLTRQSQWIDSGELFLAISESLEYARLYGIKAHGCYQGEGLLFGDSVLAVYELFETALEAAIPGADALLVNMDIRDGMLSLRIEINAPREILSEDLSRGMLTRLGGTMDVTTEQRTEYISLTLPVGGEQI